MPFLLGSVRASVEEFYLSHRLAVLWEAVPDTLCRAEPSGAPSSHIHQLTLRLQDRQQRSLGVRSESRAPFISNGLCV